MEQNQLHKQHQAPENSIPKQEKTTKSLYSQDNSETACLYRFDKGQKTYDFEKCLAFLEAKGKQQYDKEFSIHQEDRQLIFKLLIYFIRDKETADKLNLNLNKGILLSGPVGCGKTSLMYLCKNFTRKPHDFNVKACRDVAFEFAEKGYECLNKFMTKPPAQKRLTTYCFDDLGTEHNIRYFGNDCNVMAEILLSRYDHFIENKTLTHLTTNLAASEIEAYYGNRVRSRMRAMFNLIAFDKSVKDKR
jgi:DNA replication protein DnaC